jgi:hypothetical protein
MRFEFCIRTTLAFWIEIHNFQYHKNNESLYCCVRKIQIKFSYNYRDEFIEMNYY